MNLLYISPPITREEQHQLIDLTWSLFFAGRFKAAWYTFRHLIKATRYFKHTVKIARLIEETNKSKEKVDEALMEYVVDSTIDSIFTNA